MSIPDDVRAIRRQKYISSQPVLAVKSGSEQTVSQENDDESLESILEHIFQYERDSQLAAEMSRGDVSGDIDHVPPPIESKIECLLPANHQLPVAMQKRWVCRFCRHINFSTCDSICARCEKR